MTNTTVYFNDNVLGKEAFTYFALISLLTSSVCLKRVLSSSPPYFHGSLSLCIISVLWRGGRHRLRELTAIQQGDHRQMVSLFRCEPPRSRWSLPFGRSWRFGGHVRQLLGARHASGPSPLPRELYAQRSVRTGLGAKLLLADRMPCTAKGFFQM